MTTVQGGLKWETLGKTLTSFLQQEDSQELGEKVSGLSPGSK